MRRTKHIALALSLIMGISTFSACGMGGLQKEYEGATLELDLSNSYRSALILEGKADTIFTASGDCLLYNYYDNSKRDLEIGLYNAKTQEKQIFATPFYKNRESGRAISIGIVTPYEDGYAIIYNKHSTGVNSSGDTAVEHTAELYDSSLNLTDTVSIPEGFAQNTSLWKEEICTDAAGNWYVFSYESPDQGLNPKLEAYNKDFQRYGTISIPNGFRFGSLISGGDGNAYALLWKEDMADWVQAVRLSAEEKSCEEIGSPLKGSSIKSCGVTGTGEYDFYYSDQYGLRGWNDGECTEIVSWINSDFADVYEFCPVMGDQFAVKVYPMGRAPEIWLLQKRTQEEIDNTQCISLAVLYLPENLREAVMNFNRTNEGKRIMIHDYAAYNNAENEYEGGMMQFKQDMLDGIVADIICADSLQFDSLANKGMFADWYQFMENDEDFNKADYLENYFEAYETNGRLQRLGASFTINTAAAKSQYVGTEQGISASELMALRDTLPEGMMLYGLFNKSFMIENYFYNTQSCFVNRKTGSCAFDTPEFAAILQMFKDYPEMGAAGFRAVQNDEILLYEYGLNQPIAYHALKSVVFPEDDMTLVGYPVPDGMEGNGGVFYTDYTISVNSQSKYQDIVWGFVKHMLSEEYQKKLTNAMPIHKAALEEDLLAATKQSYQPMFFETGEVDVGAATEEEMEELYAYIQNIRTCWYYDETVYNILMEEMGMVLAGDQTPEEAAKMIQSRASIYLSEQS